MMSMAWLIFVICLLAAVMAGLCAYGVRRWADAARKLTDRLEAARMDRKIPPSLPTHFDLRELDGLPAPVQRYFRAVLKDGQPMVSSLTIAMAGSFNMSTTGERWKPFTSQQRVVTRRPGFLWDAQITMLPGLAARVVDGYIAGEGMLRAAVLGLLTVADVHGGGEIARGEFMRYFAEAAWYPTGLLPSQGVRWDVVDDASANATIVDGPLTLTLLFRFNDSGPIASVHAQARGAMVGKEMVMLPWECCWSNYQMRCGMMVPTTGEAAWRRPEGRKPYFIGSVRSFAYEFAP